MVELRNRIGHNYGAIDAHLVHAQYVEGAAVMRRFLARAAEEVG